MTASTAAERDRLRVKGGRSEPLRMRALYATGRARRTLRQDHGADRTTWKCCRRAAAHRDLLTQPIPTKARAVFGDRHSRPT